MSALVITKTSFLSGKTKTEIDIAELHSRLQSIYRETDVEVIKLAISTMLDEIQDSRK